MSTSPRALSLLAAALTCTTAAPAYADSDAHYQDLIVGERAAGMGGAFTALADEASGAYYNPAGIIAEGSALIQLSMSAFKWRSKRVEVADVCGTPFASDEGTFFGFPGSFGFVKQLRSGRVAHALGLTLVVPHADKYSHAVTNGRAVCGPTTLGLGSSELLVDRVFQGGLSYAIKPWRFLQAGVTVGVRARTATLVSLLAVIPDDGTGQVTYPAITFRNLEVSTWGLYFQAGVIVVPTAALRLGVSFITGQLHLSGSARVDGIVSSSDSQQWGATQISALDDVRYEWRVPLQVAVGGAYTWRWLTVAADLKLHGSVEPYAPLEHPTLAPALNGGRDVVVNANVGGEARLGRRLALRLGGFTNLTAVTRGADLGNRERTDRFGFTVGGTFRSSAASALSFALQTQLGRGTAQALRVQHDTALNVLRQERYEVPVRETLVILSVGGSYDIR